jgi:orotidine-5'-phosphate decarboxylase
VTGGLGGVPPGGTATGAREASGIAFALDFPDVDAARPVARAVAESVGMLKVGLELFLASGARGVELGRELGLPVFLDLKLHDIPETVDRAVGRAAGLGARFLTVHASGGPAMLRRAAERARKEGTGLEIVAVTVLTSMEAVELGRTGVAGSVLDQVRRLARLAYDEGVRAFVCSPREVAALREDFGDDATLIIPGIRAATGGDDQKRVASVTQAILDGADWLVIGRPIRDAQDPAVAARAFAREIAEARARGDRATHAPSRDA